jgi:hypothetical protein
MLEAAYADLVSPSAEAQHPNFQPSTSWPADYPIFGSWLCKNVLAAALTPRDFGRVAVPGHLSGFVGSFRLEVFLMRVPASCTVLQQQTDACLRRPHQAAPP